MFPDIKSLVKGVLRPFFSHTYNHHADERDATKILKSVESYKGKTGGRDLKLCDDYAVEVFEYKHLAPWLYGCIRRFKEG